MPLHISDDTVQPLQRTPTVLHGVGKRRNPLRNPVLLSRLRRTYHEGDTTGDPDSFSPVSWLRINDILLHVPTLRAVSGPHETADLLVDFTSSASHTAGHSHRPLSIGRTIPAAASLPPTATALVSNQANQGSLVILTSIRMISSHEPPLQRSQW